MREKIKCFLDSNVWLYLFDDSTSLKYSIAQKIIKKNRVFLSAQVVNEVGKNLKDPKKPFKYTESQLREVIRYLYSPRFTFVELTFERGIYGDPDGILDGIKRLLEQLIKMPEGW